MVKWLSGAIFRRRDVKIIDMQTTPNPNAMKIFVDAPVAAGTKSFFRAEAAAADPLASKLFQIDGVIGVMLLGSFLTISKHRDAEWEAVLAGVRKVLEEA
jgi:hypothetical protein